MQTNNQMTIQCPACGQPFNTPVQNLIDVGQNPAAKSLLLSGQLNVAQCPHCGERHGLAVPILYHDPAKELLVAHVPMELNMQKDMQEKIIGDLLNELTRQLPEGGFRGYMFNPKRALTLQNLMDQILEADGITPEMMQAQRERVNLVQTFSTTPDDELEALVTQYDDQIDAQFLQMFTVVAQRMLQEGRQELAEQIIRTQQAVIALSSYGKQMIEEQAAQQEMIEEVAKTIQALGEEAEQSDFFNLAVEYAEDLPRLQALVSLIRPVFDYAFFEELTNIIGQAPAGEREQLETLREQLLELTALVDQQAQLALQQAAGLLREMLRTNDLDTLIQESMPLIDDTFMAVLSANIQEADKQKDQRAMARLKEIYDKIVAVLQANMRPEIRFLNQLLSLETEEDVRELLGEHAAKFGEPLLELMDGLEHMMREQGDESLLERMAFLRQATLEALN